MVPLSCTAYKSLLNEHSKECPSLCLVETSSTFEYPITIKVHYLCSDENMISLEVLKNIYHIAATNHKKKDKTLFYIAYFTT